MRRCRLQGQEPCLLSNGSLVKEGLDLIELPTLIETGIEYRINDLRQRRQEEPVSASRDCASQSRNTTEVGKVA